MAAHDDLAETIAAFLGAEPMTIAEIRERLVADGHHVPGPDQYGLDGAFRALQATPEFNTLDDVIRPDDRDGDDDGEDSSDGVLFDHIRAVRAADLLVGVSFVIEVSDEAARTGLLADDSIDPLVWVVLAAGLVDDSDLGDTQPTEGTTQLVDVLGRRLGTVTTATVPVEKGETDAIAGPDGWLGEFAGRHVSLTVTDGRRGHLTLRVAPADGLVEPTEDQCAAVRAAFDDVSVEEEIFVPPDHITVRTAFVGRLLAAAITHDREAFTSAPLRSVTDIATAAGLEISERLATVGAPGTDWGALDHRSQIMRLQMMHGLDDDQANGTMALVGCALEVDENDRLGFGPTPDEQIAAIALMAHLLDDPMIADAAWSVWDEREAIPDRIDEFADHMGEVFEETKSHGVEWLRARLALEHARPLDAEQILRDVIDLPPISGEPAERPHTGITVLLAGIEADRGNARSVVELLDRIDDPDDAENDLRRSLDQSLDTVGLRREVAPFLVRPRAAVGRNDRCPCGSGKKYKQCHLGSEQHPITERATWLYQKAGRYQRATGFDDVWDVAEGLVGPDADDEELDSMAHSRLTIDLLLHEGGAFREWLDRRGELLPDDEHQMALRWVDTPRDVYEVTASTPERLELVAPGSGERRIVEVTLPSSPLPTGLFLAARPLPVGGSCQLHGGLAPVRPEYVDMTIEACADGDLTRVIDAIGLSLDATRDELAE